MFHSTSLPNFNYLRHTQPTQQQVQAFKNLLHMLRIREKKRHTYKKQSVDFQFYARNLVRFWPTLSGPTAQTTPRDPYFFSFGILRIFSSFQPYKIYYVICTHFLQLVTSVIKWIFYPTTFSIVWYAVTKRSPLASFCFQWIKSSPTALTRS